MKTDDPGPALAIGFATFIAAVAFIGMTNTLLIALVAILVISALALKRAGVTLPWRWRR